MDKTENESDSQTKETPDSSESSNENETHAVVEKKPRRIDTESSSGTTSDGDSSDSDLQIARISRRTKNHLDLVLGSDIDSDDSTTSDDDASDDSGENNLKEKEKELIQKIFPDLKDDPMSESPAIKTYKTQFGYRIPKLLRKQAIGHKRKRQSAMNSVIYSDAVYHFHADGMRELQGHTGCVNSLGWSNSGARLVSGSDDLHFCIWNPGRSSDEPLTRFRTGTL
mgnify:CR=1 FL=1